MTDRILAPDFVVTVDAALRVLDGGAVAVRGGRIAAVGALAEVRADHPDLPVERLADRLVMPGLINAHMHSGMLRGTAEHLPVWDWLTLHVNPMHRVLTAEEAEAAAFLAYAESVLSGTTTLVDMWRFMDGAGRAAEAIGNRLVMVPYVGAHPDYGYFESLDDNERTLETWRGRAGGRIDVWVGLEHLFYADDAGIARAIDMARRHGAPFHTHLSEADIEPPAFVERVGGRPVAALETLGFFETPHVHLAHAVWLDETEIEICARHGASVSHNPISNMKLASGIAPVEAMLAAGIAVGLGTDGEKENNNFDMFEEVKAASLLAKLKDRNAAALDSWDALRLGTIEGARALRLEREIGSIEVGKKADLIAVRTDTPRMTPLFGAGDWLNLHHNLVHAVRGSDVTLTLVDGREVARDGRLAGADMGEIIARVNRLAPGLFARRADWLAANGGLKQWTDA